MSYEIRDINLAESGEHKIDWVRKNCPLLRSLEEDFSEENLQRLGITVRISNISLEQALDQIATFIR